MTPFGSGWSFGAQVGEQAGDNPFSAPTGLKASAPAFVPQEDPTRYCKFFNLPIGCSKGDQCRFVHKKYPEDFVPPVSPPLNAQAPRSATVCSFYAKGNCRKGDQCEFLHEAPRTGQLEPAAPKQEHPKADMDEPKGDAVDKEWKVVVTGRMGKEEAGKVAAALRVKGFRQMTKPGKGQKMTATYASQKAAQKAFKAAMAAKPKQATVQKVARSAQKRVFAIQPEAIVDHKPEIRKSTTEAPHKSSDRVAARQKRFQSTTMPSVPQPPASVPTVVEQDEEGDVEGQCMAMCPPAEIEERKLMHTISPFERTNGQVDPAKCVKAYSRSDAGKQRESATTIRPPPILQKTLEYLMTLLDSETELHKTCHFLSDRMRSIRKDLSMQAYSTTGMEIVQTVCRFLLYCQYALCDNTQVFSLSQNRKQIADSLITLNHYYTDFCERQIACPSIHEFVAYRMLLNLNNPSEFQQACFDAQIYGVLSDPLVRQCLRIERAYSTCDYTAFFALLRSSATPFLCKCATSLLWTPFRIQQLQVLQRAYQKIDVEALQQMLAYDTSSDAVRLLEACGVSDPQSGVWTASSSELSFDQPMFHCKSNSLIQPYAGDLRMLFLGPNTPQTIPDLSADHAQIQRQEAEREQIRLHRQEQEQREANERKQHEERLRQQQQQRDENQKRQMEERQEEEEQLQRHKERKQYELETNAVFEKGIAAVYSSVTQKSMTALLTHWRSKARAKRLERAFGESIRPFPAWSTEFWIQEWKQKLDDTMTLRSEFDDVMRSISLRRWHEQLRYRQSRHRRKRQVESFFSQSIPVPPSQRHCSLPTVYTPVDALYPSPRAFQTTIDVASLVYPTLAHSHPEYHDKSAVTDIHFTVGVAVRDPTLAAWMCRKLDTHPSQHPWMAQSIGTETRVHLVLDDITAYPSIQGLQGLIAFFDTHDLAGFPRSLLPLLSTRVPLAIMLVNGTRVDVDAYMSRLQLTSLETVATFPVFQRGDTSSFESKSIAQAIAWIASHVPPQPQPNLVRLSSLCAQEFQPILDRMAYEDCLEHPSVLQGWVDVIQSARERVRDRVCGPVISKCDWPPTMATQRDNLPPRTWNSKDSLDAISAALDAIGIPPQILTLVHSHPSTRLDQFQHASSFVASCTAWTPDVQHDIIRQLPDCFEGPHRPYAAQLYNFIACCMKSQLSHLRSSVYCVCVHR